MTDEEASEDEDDEEEEEGDLIGMKDRSGTSGSPIPFPSEAEVARLLALPIPPQSSLTPLSSPLPQIPSPPLPISSPPLPLPSPPTTSPTYAEAPLGYKAARIRMRAASPSLLLPSTSHKTDIPEASKKGRMPTKIELTLEQSQQGVSNDVLSPTHYPCDSARTFRVILFSIHNDEWKSFQCHHQTALRSYALSWKPCQGDSLNLPDHRIHKDGDGDASFQLKSDSLPHAHAHSTKTFYKHQDSKNQESLSPNCHGCALWRKKLKEVWFTICHENRIYQDLLNTYESSDDDTNVVNAPREPFIVKQDPGENSSQSPLQINHNCCYECGDSLDGIFCQQCTCKSCGKGAHIGFNCPPKAPIISNPEPYNQTIDELLQTSPSFDPTCYSEKENSLPYVSKPNFVDDSPNVFNPPPQPPIYSCEFCGNSPSFANHPPQPQYVPYSCELFGNDSHYGYDCAPQIPICYDDDEDYTSAVTPILLTEEPVDSLIMEDEHLDTIPATESDEVIKSSVKNLVQIPSESEGIFDGVYDVPLCDNPTPLKAFKEHSETVIDFNNDSTSSDDDSPYGEDFDYVDASPPDAEIVSSEVVEIVIPEVGGIDTDILLIIKDDILREKLLNVNLLIANIEALKDNPTLSSDLVTKSSSTSLNFFLEETNTFDNSLPETETFCFNLEDISSGSTTTRSDLSLLDYEAFYNDHLEEKSSGSTTTHSEYDSFIIDLSINPFPPANRSDFYHEEFADEFAHIISLPEYDCFCFKNESELGKSTMDVVGDIYPTREPRVHVPNVLPTHPTLHLDLDFILFSDSLFAYIVWIFLPFLTYPVAPPYLLSCGNEDTIFDPGIPIHHSFMSGFPEFLKPLVLAVVLRSQELHILSFILGIRYPNLID
ncbi:hypothetical protein Tco_0163402 [Tanacetum coccineum]